MYVGLQHLLNDKWSLGEKIYWSGWSIQKNLYFKNTATRSFIVPTNWKDVWSYQITTRYAITEKMALLGSVIYETNPNPTPTNSIGYPLAASTFSRFEKYRVYRIAKRSPTECSAILDICQQLQLIEPGKLSKTWELLFRIVSMLIKIVKNNN